MGNPILSELPLNVEFAAAYLDGVMECDQPEIRKQWSIVRCFLAGLTAMPLQALSPTPEPQP